MYIYSDHTKVRKINENFDKTNSLGVETKTIKNDLYKLQSDFEKTCLINQALLEIVQDKLGVSDSELEAKILEIDLRDGKADGKMGGSITTCPNCNRKVNAKKGSCLYCGAELTNEHKFEL